MSSFRLRTGPDLPHHLQEVGENGFLAGVKAQAVADELDRAVILERGAGDHWMADTAYFPRSSGTPSMPFEPPPMQEPA